MDKVFKCPNCGGTVTELTCVYCGTQFNQPAPPPQPRKAISLSARSHYTDTQIQTCDAKTFARMRNEWGSNWRKGWIQLSSGDWAPPKGVSFYDLTHPKTVL